MNKEMLPVVYSPFALRAPVIKSVPIGVSIREIVALYPHLPPDIAVEINGVPIPPDKWDIIPTVDQHVCVFHALHNGGGGMDLTRTLLMVAVVIASIATGQAYGAAFAAQIGASTVTGAAIIQTAAMTAGMMLVNAIAPIRVESSTSVRKKEDATYGITGGSNSANPFGPVPVVLGTHRMYPLYGALPYTELVGNDEYLRMLFV